MSEPDQVAVVISTYNNPDFLQLVLQAYKRQTDTHFKIYIADDGSKNETRELIERFSEDFPVSIEHVWHEDKGFRKATIHNAVIRRIREPYILFTDGDCIPLSGMIATHRRLAQKNTLISGRRILISQAWTRELCKQKRFPDGNNVTVWLRRRLRGEVNRIVPMLLPVYLGATHQRLQGIRGCHLSCWHRDVLQVDGFDEIYEGWGREDSDLVMRLFHSGVQRRDLRGQPLLHLWHPEEQRDGLSRNDLLLEESLKNGRIRAQKGLSCTRGDSHA
ncbi:MAG: glycosyltransferase [Mariprofundaceae bacterium]